MFKIFAVAVIILSISGCAFIGAGTIGEAVYVSPDQKLNKQVLNRP